VERIITVKMADMDIVQNSNGDSIKLKTILGSCVGVILSDKKREIHGLAHIMLPEMKKNDKVVGKYADTAIPLLLKKMELKGSSRKDIKALVLGGASIFTSESDNGFMNIGANNIKAARRTLKELKIPIVFEDTGGNNGRTIIFECSTGKVIIKTLDKNPLKGVHN